MVAPPSLGTPTTLLDRYRAFEDEFGPAYKLPDGIRERAFQLRQKITIAVCQNDEEAFDKQFQEYRALWSSTK